MFRRQLLITALVVAVGFSVALPAAQSQPDLEKRVATLEAQVRALNAQIAALRSMVSAPPPAGAPTPAPTRPAGPEIDQVISIAGRPTKGQATAKLAIVEFSDFQCPYCGKYAREIYPQVIREFVNTGRAEYVFRHYPIESLHPDAMNAARAAECAFGAGKFWEVHDRLFDNQARLQLSQLPTYAQGLGIDDAKFRACLASPAVTAKVGADRQQGQQLGVTGTPFFFVGIVAPNNQVRLLRQLKGTAPIESFRSAVEAVMKVMEKR